MNLLSVTILQVKRFFRNPSAFSALILFALVGLEILGRRSPSDFFDTVAGTALLFLGILVVRRHRTDRLPWVDRIQQLLKKFLRSTHRFNIDLGLDLRGEPRLRRRIPPGIFLLFLIFSTANILAFAIWHWFPNGWREPLISISYLLYLGCSMLLWSVQGIGVLIGVGLPFRTLGAVFPRLADFSDSRVRLQLMSMSMAYLFVVFFISTTLSLRICMIFIDLAILATLYFFVSDRVGSVGFLWRPANSFRVYVVSTRRAITCLLGCALLCLSATILLSSGNRLISDQSAEQTMPVTIWVGLTLAWLMPGLIFSVTVWLMIFSLRNPARPAVPRLYLVNRVVGKTRLRLERAVRSQGWLLLSSPIPRNKIDVPIRLVSPARSQALEFNPNWPLRVSIDDIEGNLVFERLSRYRELRHRKLLRTGFERLFSSLRSHNFDSGNGFWMAPHLWLQPGLARDEEIDPTDMDRTPFPRIVGPLYRELFPRASRNYLNQVLRQAQLDVIFFEDGIRFSGFWRVMRAIFDAVDKSSGKEAIHETNFHGIPKVRVMIHDLQLDVPFESNTYPEPKFDLLGRARVLHIFKDRGDQEELVEPPADFSFNPLPIRGA
jgi:hypothetical protein